MTKGEQIMEFWDPAIKKAGLDDTVMFTFANSDLFEKFDVEVKPGAKVSDKIICLTTKVDRRTMR